MKLSLLSLVAFLTIGHAALPPELYWKSILPDTAMPKSIKDLLHQYGNLSGGGPSTFHTKYDYAPATTRFIRYGPSERFNTYDEPETQLQDSPFPSLFFLEKELKIGHKKNLIFTNASNQPFFLPREVVKSIPFSSSKVDEILRKYALKPGSTDAEIMKNTIKACEEPGIKGEDKYCATSLESMLDFTILKLGKHVEALSTEVMKKKETKKQEYKIMSGVKKVGEANVVVCHKLNYVYAVFYCHKMETTRAYTVPLEGEDGSRVKAMAICHTNTSGWNPKHLAFQVLKRLLKFEEAEIHDTISIDDWRKVSHHFKKFIWKEVEVCFTIEKTRARCTKESYQHSSEGLCNMVIICCIFSVVITG